MRELVEAREKDPWPSDPNRRKRPHVRSLATRSFHFLDNSAPLTLPQDITFTLVDILTLGTRTQGRASIDMALKFKTPREDNVRGGVLHIVVDGYNAPLR